MGLSEIEGAGINANLLIRAANNMNAIHNEHRPQYDEQLALIRAAYPGKAMSALTDAEVNDFFFNGMGDAATIAEAQGVLLQWEASMLCLSECVSLLPGNNI